MPVGTATIDFGSTPVVEASVVVTGQAAITALSFVEAFVQSESTADNSETNHRFAGVSFRMVCGTIVVGTGFTIYVTCLSGKATGTFKIRWVWS